MLAELLTRDPYLHLYSLGDLDPFFFPDTSWVGSFAEGKLRQVVMLYEGSALPCLLAFTREPDEMQQLLEAARGYLPRSFYAHLSEGVEPLSGWQWRERGVHLRMGLKEQTSTLRQETSEGIERLTPADLTEVKRFYQTAYPGNFFDAKMLQTQKYFGIRKAGELCAVAGVHTYSAERRVAALGNIATHPDHRRQGLGTRLTAHLCRDLLDSVDVIGLNVAADNETALRCYRLLGFEEVARYREYAVEPAS